MDRTQNKKPHQDSAAQEANAFRLLAAQLNREGRTTAALLAIHNAWIIGHHSTPHPTAEAL